jgi:hypothetical protein
MKLIDKLQTLMTAAAFAEENDHRTAIQIAAETDARPSKTREAHPTLAGTLALNHGK